MSKYVNDVRALSSNSAYMGVEFGGVDTIDEAIQQAREAKDHGFAEQFVPKGMSRNRAALLQHLNLLRIPGKYTVEYAEGRGWLTGPAKLAMELDPRN
jgi:hypothetical protein